MGRAGAGFERQKQGRFGRPEWLEVEASHVERRVVSGQKSASWEPRVEPQGPVTGSPSRAATKELKLSLQVARPHLFFLRPTVGGGT